MSVEKHFAFAGTGDRVGVFAPNGPITPITVMNGDLFKSCIYCEAGWIKEPHKREELVKHGSDELIMFVGSDPNDSENLNAEIEMQVGNDILRITETCFVFVPAGVAHGKMHVKSLKKPVFTYFAHLNADMYESEPATATEPAGQYAGNMIKRYEPVDGKLPTAPEGFLTLLLWIDGKKLAGAPYTEAVWFNRENDTGPEEHDHDFDEFIGFFGSDPERPGELNGEITFMIDGSGVTFTKDCLIYIPRGVNHSPLLVPKVEKPIIHFSGGNGGDYKRSSGEF